MQGLELIAVNEWIYSTLHGDATFAALLGGVDEVYSDTAPPSAEYPFCEFTMQSNADTATVEEVRVLVRANYIVKVIDRAESYARLKAPASRIDALLHRAAGTVVDGQILFCARAQTLMYPEMVDGVNYRHLGGIYRLWVQGA